MKLITHLGVALMVLGAVAAAPAHAQTNCSNSSLSGDYAITITGAILGGPSAGPVNGVNLTHFDGGGGLTSVDHVIINGVVPGAEWRAAVGTYTLNANCTGQASFTYPDGQSPGLSYFFVLHNSQMDIVVSTPGFNITATGTERQ